MRINNEAVVVLVLGLDPGALAGDEVEPRAVAIVEKAAAWRVIGGVSFAAVDDEMQRVAVFLNDIDVCARLDVFQILEDSGKRERVVYVTSDYGGAVFSRHSTVLVPADIGEIIR